MQISRHWRLKAQRYRLQGVRYANGEVSLQSRPFPPSKTIIVGSKEGAPVQISVEQGTSNPDLVEDDTKVA